jgi:hypothetical protein
MEWTKEQILDHIKTSRLFASFKLNRISSLIADPFNQIRPTDLSGFGINLTDQSTPNPQVTDHNRPDTTSVYDLLLNSEVDNAIGPQAPKDDPLPGLPTPIQSLEPQPNITTTLSAQAPPAQAPSAQAPSTQAPSAQAPPAQAPLASPSSLTKAKEPWQPSLYKPPQPAQQQYNPPATALTPPSLPPAQYLHPGTANTNPNMQLHMDQPRNRLKDQLRNRPRNRPRNRHKYG